jgi:hypothetical protein
VSSFIRAQRFLIVSFYPQTGASIEGKARNRVSGGSVKIEKEVLKSISGVACGQRGWAVDGMGGLKSPRRQFGFHKIRRNGSHGGVFCSEKQGDFCDSTHMKCTTEFFKGATCLSGPPPVRRTPTGLAERLKVFMKENAPRFDIKLEGAQPAGMRMSAWSLGVAASINGRCDKGGNGNDTI